MTSAIRLNRVDYGIYYTDKRSLLKIYRDMVYQCHPGVGLQRIKISRETPPGETSLHGILKMWVRIS